MSKSGRRGGLASWLSLAETPQQTQQQSDIPKDIPANRHEAPHWLSQDVSQRAFTTIVLSRWGEC